MPAFHRAVLLVLADGASDAQAYQVRALGYALRDVAAVLPISERVTDQQAADLAQQQRDSEIYERGRRDALAELSPHAEAITAKVADVVPPQSGPPAVETDTTAIGSARGTDGPARSAS